MDLKFAWTIIAVVAVFIYNIILFRYVSTILRSCSRSMPLHVAIATLNTVLVTYVTYIDVYYHGMFFVVFAILSLEFYLISKTTVSQALLGAVIVSFHQASIHMPIVMIFSRLLEVPPLTLLSDVRYSFEILFITIIVLLLAMFVVKKLIPTNYIRRASLTSPYSEMLAGATAFILVYLSFDSFCLITNVYFPEQSLQIFSVILVSMVMFYFLFIYTINCINLSMYKRHSDAAEQNYAIVLDLKREASNKLVTDNLTKLYNKKFIFEKLDSLIAIPDIEFGMLTLDINALKYVNDNFGHDKGDFYILEIADAIKASIRESDLAARVSGDEFFVLLPETENIESLKTVHVRLQEHIASKKSINGFQPSASVGILYVNDALKAKGAQTLLDMVDQNMRDNKKAFYANKSVNKEKV